MRIYTNLFWPELKIPVWHTLISAVILFLDREFFSFSNILYIQLLYSIIGASIIIAIFLFFRKSSEENLLLGYRVLLATLLTTTLFSYSLLNIDRSRSIQVIRLIELNRELGNSKVESLSNFRYKNTPFLNPDIQQRIQEQVELGTIVIKDKEINLSVYGDVIFVISNQLAQIYNLTGFFFDFSYQS
jgi:hypothetical protein